MLIVLRPSWRATPPLMGVAVSAVLAAGCGSAGPTSGTARTSQRSGSSAAVSTAPAPGTTPATSPAEAPTQGATGAVPNETNLELRVAQQHLRLKHIPYKVLRRGQAPGPVSGTWIVCAMNPAPRTHLETGTVVRLLVAAACH